MGEGTTYRESQKGRVHCRQCGEEMAAGYMVSHMMTQHGWVAEARQSWKTLVTGEGLRTYRMAFLAKDARGAAQWRDSQAKCR